MPPDHTTFIVHNLIPLYDGVEIEFTCSWCHARFLSLRAVSARGQRWARLRKEDEPEPSESELMEEVTEGYEPPPSGFLEVEFRGAARVNTHRIFDMNLLSQPQLIKLLSLLTFLTGRVHTTGSSTGNGIHYPLTTKAGLPPAPEPSPTRFVADGDDRSDELVAILEATSESDFGLLVFSVMDRWRKGRVLAKEPTQEEAMLCYFHILESVGHHYSREAKSEIRFRVDAFVAEVTDAVLLPDLGARPSLTNRLSKDFELALASLDSFGARAQIAFALNKLGLLDSKTAALLSRLVKARNAIAHGQLSAAVPMHTFRRPFFQHTDPRDEDLLDPLTVLSARTIAALCRAATWSDVWEEEKVALHPPDGVVKAFLDAEVTPTPAEFEAGLHNGVRPTSVALYWLRKLNKRGLAPLEQALGDYFKNVTVSDANVHELLLPALLLADSEDQSIQAAARRAVQAAWTTNALESHPSDVWKEITVYGVEPEWLASWARSGGPPEGEAGASNEASE